MLKYKYKCNGAITSFDEKSPMAPHLSGEGAFVKFLLETEPTQQIAILSTVTDNQVRALSEIAYNLPKLEHLGPHQRFITYLGDQKHKIRYKKYIIRKHGTRLLRVLNTVKDKLLDFVA